MACAIKNIFIDERSHNSFVYEFFLFSTSSLSFFKSLEFNFRSRNSTDLICAAFIKKLCFQRGFSGSTKHVFNVILSDANRDSSVSSSKIYDSEERSNVFLHRVISGHKTH